MAVRLLALPLIAATALVAGGCAQSPSLSFAGLANTDLQPIASAQAQDDSVELSYARRKTLAGKVLTAIALERVTGLRPDPARFSEVD
ncbi:MAG: hypothetical protein NW217_03305 [Hyphomicrobiaceae bacterium]|nr:hypothetical protein [Hyphomicrobiaceae bacterium]